MLIHPSPEAAPEPVPRQDVYKRQEWTLSDYDVVDIDGDVNQDAFEETDDEQGKLISASVELSCCLLYTSRCV